MPMAPQITSIQGSQRSRRLARFGLGGTVSCFMGYSLHKPVGWVVVE